MGRTACTEPQCLYKGDLYLYLTLSTAVTKQNLSVVHLTLLWVLQTGFSATMPDPQGVLGY